MSGRFDKQTSSCNESHSGVLRPKDGDEQARGDDWEGTSFSKTMIGTLSAYMVSGCSLMDYGCARAVQRTASGRRHANIAIAR